MSVDDHLEYRHLKYVIAVAETGSMSAAAARLHVAQSAISEQICAIEGIFEIRIFVRSRDGCTLTAEGRVLLPFAYAAVDDRKHIIQTLQAIRAGSLTPLRLGFSPFVEKSLLEGVTQAYRNLLPGCEILPESGETDELALRVRGDGLDAAIVTLPIDSEGLRIKVLERERLVVCLRSDDPLAGDVAISPAALDDKLSIFDYQRYHPAAYARIVEMLQELGITPRPSTPTMNSEHIQWMVKEGIGYSLVRAGRPLIEGLVSRPIAGAYWTIDSALIAKAGKQHPALPLLVRELTKRFPAELEILPKKLPTTTQFRETAKDGTEDQLALFVTKKASDREREPEGHRSKLYRHRK
jgi:DNA-binding transcriptional LysR family regulator